MMNLRMLEVVETIAEDINFDKMFLMPRPRTKRIFSYSFLRELFSNFTSALLTNMRTILLGNIIYFIYLFCCSN